MDEQPWKEGDLFCFGPGNEYFGRVMPHGKALKIEQVPDGFGLHWVIGDLPKHAQRVELKDLKGPKASLALSAFNLLTVVASYYLLVPKAADT